MEKAKILRAWDCTWLYIPARSPKSSSRFELVTIVRCYSTLTFRETVRGSVSSFVFGVNQLLVIPSCQLRTSQVRLLNLQKFSMGFGTRLALLSPRVLCSP